jgi:8-oxo-dGTP pyrophosphatase MutT (NUDIX family)
MPVTSEQIAEILRDTRIAEQPGRQALDGLPADLIEAWFVQPLREAAVLLPLLQREEGLTVLFTRRTDHVRDHAGQISFPGGSREAHDSDLMATALRESFEEIGLPPAAVTVIGYLEPHPVITGFAVLPVVGIVEPPESFLPDPGEVAEIFEVPLSHLMDPAHFSEHVRYRSGVGLPTCEYQYDDYSIWGATAHMLQSFIKSIS